MKGKRLVLRIVLLTLLTILTVALIAIGVFAVLGWNMHQEAVTGRPVRQVYAELSQEEHFVEFDELPEFYVNAVVATEDRDFWGHSGIDPSAIVRALLHDIAARDFAEGGSTITMQTAKNLYYTQDKRLERKTAEVFTAFELEDKLDKKQIFELYVNTIYFGSNYYGSTPPRWDTTEFRRQSLLTSSVLCLPESPRHPVRIPRTFPRNSRIRGRSRC